MREALVYAVAVAVSPVPIVAVLLLLTSPSGVANALCFVGGWVVGVAALITVFAALVRGAGVSDADPAWIAAADVLLGAAFVAASIALWTGSRRRGELDVPWLDAVDGLTRARSGGLGVLLAGANPKVVALSLGAALALAGAGATASSALQTVILFTAIGATGVLVPLAVYVTASARARPMLLRLRAWLGRHEVRLLVALGLLVGALFLRDGLESL